MPRYTYIAKSQPRKTIQGNIEAESQQDAISKLTKMGYFPISLKPETSLLEKQGIFPLQKISNKDIVLFTRQLSSLIGSGVNIINGLIIISNQTSNKYLKMILNDIIGRIKDGKSLSESLAAHPYLFSNLYSSMILSGEASGDLDDALKRLADFLEKGEEFRNSLRASLTYPFFVFIVGVLTVFVLIVFVIPRLVIMFEDMGQILPLPTRILIDISGFLRSYWWIIFLIIFIFIFFLRKISRSPQGKIFWDRFKLKLPILGQIILKTEIGRLMHTLSLLRSSGVPIISCLDISTSLVENQILKSEVQRFKEQIGGGLSLSNSFKSSKLIPEAIISIMAIGEETGSLEKSLMRIAGEYEREVDRTLKTLTQFLEPVIILAMGLIVGFIVLSMLLPIFQINLIVR
ncbi:MAG: hypothetical protein FJZ16_05265 [Candidatus Omnitrophica bacterium]|nr:hypothetical protein [Candidatus Omnitrophota bacterium]